MSLVTCKECKKEISSSADKCPHCGFKPSSNIGCGSIVIVFVLILGALSVLSGNNSNSPSHTSSSDSQSSAKGACMLFIKQVLHDPDSAEFGHSSEAYAKEESPGIWTVHREVRAKNAFNAMRLSTFECKMTLNGEAWNAISVKEIN